MAKPTQYKKGQAFVFNGEEGWTIISVETKGMFIERQKPFKQAYVPFDTLRT